MKKNMHFGKAKFQKSMHIYIEQDVTEMENIINNSRTSMKDETLKSDWWSNIRKYRINSLNKK